MSKFVVLASWQADTETIEADSPEAALDKLEAEYRAANPARSGVVYADIRIGHWVQRWEDLGQRNFIIHP